MKAKSETPTPYEHVMVKFKIKHQGGSTHTYEKKGWYEPIGNIYLIPREWENCSYGQRPATLEGFRLQASEVVDWKNIKA